MPHVKTQCHGCDNEASCILRISRELKGTSIETEAYPFDSIIAINKVPLESIVNVKSGVIGVWMASAQGSEAICGLYSAGQTIGWTGIFESKPPAVVLRSLTNAVVCRQHLFPSRQDAEVYRSDEAFKSIIRKDISTFLLTWTLQGPSLKNRLLRLLTVIALYTSKGDARVEQLAKGGLASPGVTWKVTFQTTHEVLARVLHSNRAAVTRALGALKEEGILSVTYRSISLDMTMVPLFGPAMDFPVEMLGLFEM